MVLLLGGVKQQQQKKLAKKKNAIVGITQKVDVKEDDANKES